MNVRERLSSLLAFLAETKAKIAAAPLDVNVDRLIRGDSSKMKQYLETLGLSFPDIGTPHCQIYRKRWRTNQFFSTSVGHSLAGPASRALVWLIRIDKKTTKGRSGGHYTSESEILFPYDVEFELEGVIHVGAETNIAGLKLNLLTDPERVRSELTEVYQANRFTQQTAPWFLVAKEV